MASTNGGFTRASASATMVPNTSSRPPASIQQLAQLAEVPWDPSNDFKYWLKVAEKARHRGQDYDLRNDLENAFVEYAKAATLILDKIPTHRDYQTRLDSTQRETLVMKGKGVLDRMGMIKPILIDRHNIWEDAQARGEDPQRPLPPQNSYEPEYSQREAAAPRRDGQQRDGRQIWYPDSAIASQEKRRKEESQAQAAQSRAEQRAREQAGILQRQRESEDEARAVRRAAAYNASPTSQSGFVSIPVANPITPQRSSAQASKRRDYDMPLDTPPLLPLESPMRRDVGSTDVDTEEGNGEELYKQIAELSLDPQLSSSTAVVSPFGVPAPPTYNYHLGSAIDPQLSLVSTTYDTTSTNTRIHALSPIYVHAGQLDRATIDAPLRKRARD
ncbi:hypothetical protein EW145_g2317 [Phellinidium pouzarii]|uniref:USP8 dimerisation domain-containing protein n=1 Tax=Phellinidium pouzarii TaxID=167371 RepID=A0A4S4LBB0_9AGAM|nr:hypothetical protein EW145_g2317 [Phellinidium pouzarii]